MPELLISIPLMFGLTALHPVSSPCSFFHSFLPPTLFNLLLFHLFYFPFFNSIIGHYRLTGLRRIIFIGNIGTRYPFLLLLFPCRGGQETSVWRRKGTWTDAEAESTPFFRAISCRLVPTASFCRSWKGPASTATIPSALSTAACGE